MYDDVEAVMLMSVLQEPNADKARARYLRIFGLDEVNDRAIYEIIEARVLDAVVRRDPVIEIECSLALAMLFVLKNGIRRSRGGQKNNWHEDLRKRTLVMHLEYQALIQASPELESRLRRLPGAVFSGRKRVAKGIRGVFFCYALPALDKEKNEFTEEAGTTRWYFCDLDRDAILEEPGEIVESIRSKPDTPRRCTTQEKALVEIRAKIEKHIKNTYLKRVDAPVGVKPVLKCWMELNEG